MAAWQLNILGGFALCTPDGTDFALPTRKDRLLLACLALNAGRPQTRDRLCGLLWPDRSQAQARGSLRQSLAALRDAVGSAIFRADRDTITLDPAAIEIDALRFLAQAKTGESAAADLYGGELLHGIDLPSPEFEQWLRPERQQFEDAAAQLVLALADHPSAKIGVISLARQLLQRDPLREPLYRALMRLLVYADDRAGALRTYSNCRDALNAELGIGPELETEQLYREILTGRDASPASTILDRPSLAVLPFANPGGDPALVPLCEGLAEDITSGLSRFRPLFVIDRHSAAEVAKLTKDAVEVGKRLGVAFVVQGSLVKLPGRLRLAVALVNAASRAQIWSDVFDVAEAEIPAIPERIVAPLVNTLHGRVEHTLSEQARRKPALAAYECVLRGIKHIRGYGPDDNIRAVELFQKAVELDPDYALARAYRAFSNVVLHGYATASPEILHNAKAMGEEAVEMDPDDARCHWLLGVTCASLGDEDAERRHHLRAMELNPNDANIKASYGAGIAAAGRVEEGLAYMREAMRLNPYHPEWYWVDLGSVLYSAHRYEEALDAFKHRNRPGTLVLARLAACYAQLDRMDEARRTVAELLRIRPNFTISRPGDGSFFPGDDWQFFDGMRKAGLTD